MRGEQMRRFWDDRARENAYYYVDNRLDYGDPDTEQFWTEGQADLDALLEIAGTSLDAGDRVVEIGCGIGRLTREIAGRVASVEAIDISETMLELARKENPHLSNVNWVLGDGESLSPLADGSVDVCLSHVVFQHIPDPEITLGYVAEMGRVLVPGGWAVFQISNQPLIHDRVGIGSRIQGWMRGVTGMGPRGQVHPAWRGSAVEIDRLRAVAETSGLAVQSVVGAGTQFCVVRLVRAG